MHRAVHGLRGRSIGAGVNSGHNSKRGGKTALVRPHLAARNKGRTVWKGIQGQAIGQQIAFAASMKHVYVVGAVACIRTRIPVGCHGSNDEVWIGLGKRVRIQPLRVWFRGLAVVDDYVCVGREFSHDHPALRVVQIECDPVLSGVQVQEQPAALRVGRISGERPLPPSVVAGAWRFHLDHYCPKRRQQLAAVGSGHVLRDFQNA